MSQQNDAFRDSFDDIFSKTDIPTELKNTEDIESLMSPNKKKNAATDYNARRAKLYKKAKVTITSLLKFYLAEAVISEDEYFHQKSLQDEATLGDILNQIEMSNAAINTLMGTIDRGDISPRFFEMLSESQKTFIELLKMKTSFIIQMEETTKKLLSDKDTYASANDRKELEEGSISTRGTKNLMLNIQTAIKKNDVEDVK